VVRAAQLINPHPEKARIMTITYQALTIGNADVFYREAGRSDAPVILLLHGFPTAGHMFRDLIPILADSYRVIAPDLPGFGNTKAPPRGRFDYTFDALAQVIAGFIEALKLDRYALYVFDYGAPVGFRIAQAHPERVSAIISQKTATLISRGLAAHGVRGRPTGANRLPSTVRRAATRSRRRRSATGNISMVPIQAGFRPTATSSTFSTWPVPERTKYSSI